MKSLTILRHAKSGWDAPVERDFDRLYRALSPGFSYANSAVIDVDDVLHRGTQEYLLRGGRGSGARPV